jgi:DNA-binding beta-propeller fold protein YncE
MKKIFALCFIATSVILAQNFEFSESIGNFNKASSFYITANGLIYVSDAGKDEIILLDTLGNKLKSFGGYGWDENSFDDPADVFADPLTIYVADKNNHKIKRFDKNLNFIYSLYTRDSDIQEEQFGYPLSCATSNQGDLFFIDSDNKRIMKFDIFGKFIMNFGGFDAGNYQLSAPTQLAVSSANNVFVIDGSDIVIFDHFGNGNRIINVESKIKSIRILFDQLVICTEEKIYNTYLKSENSKLIEVDTLNHKFNSQIISAIIINSKLFVLTSNELLVFNQIK